MQEIVTLLCILGVEIEPLTLNDESCGTPVAYSVIIKQASENAKKPNVSPIKVKENFNRDVLEEKQKAAETRRKVSPRYSTSVRNLCKMQNA